MSIKLIPLCYNFHCNGDYRVKTPLNINLVIYITRNMTDIYEYSTPELVRLLGERFKDYRLRCQLTQKEIAEHSGVGLTTIHKFENGTAGNISMSTFIQLLRSIGSLEAIDDILPELPPSAYLVRRYEKQAQRVRHSKK